MAAEFFQPFSAKWSEYAVYSPPRSVHSLVSLNSYQNQFVLKIRVLEFKRATQTPPLMNAIVWKSNSIQPVVLNTFLVF